MKYEKAIKKIQSEGCDSVPHAHKIMCLGAMPKPLQNWLMDNTFVFMWVPLCILIEFIIIPVYVPVIFLTFWLSWDRQYKKNCTMVTEWFVLTSSILPFFIEPNRNTCPYCDPLDKMEDLLSKHDDDIKSMVLYSKDGIDYVRTRSGDYLSEYVYKITPEFAKILNSHSKCHGIPNELKIERYIARPKVRK